MNIYDKVTIEILKYVDKMNNDEEFKKTNPEITAQEFLCARVNPNITQKRLVNILNGKAHRITRAELVVISRVLRIELIDLFKDNEEVK